MFWMIQLILMQNPEIFSARLGIDFGHVCYTLQLTHILLNNNIKQNLSNDQSNEIDQSNYQSIDKFIVSLATLEVQFGEFLSNHGGILL